MDTKRSQWGSLFWNNGPDMFVYNMHWFCWPKMGMQSTNKWLPIHLLFYTNLLTYLSSRQWAISYIYQIMLHVLFPVCLMFVAVHVPYCYSWKQLLETGLIRAMRSNLRVDFQAKTHQQHINNQNKLKAAQYCSVHIQLRNWLLAC